MNEIDNMKNEIKEVISMTEQKLDVLLSIDLLKIMNDLFASSKGNLLLASSSVSSNNPDNSVLIPDLSKSLCFENNLDIFIKMSNNCKEYELKFENKDIDLEQIPTLILEKFINILKNVIGNCACKLKNLKEGKYNKLFNKLINEINETDFSTIKDL